MEQLLLTLFYEHLGPKAILCNFHNSQIIEVFKDTLLHDYRQEKQLLYRSTCGKLFARISREMHNTEPLLEVFMKSLHWAIFFFFF